MTWPNTLFLNHATWNWTVDATASGISVEQFNTLKWRFVFEQIRKLEDGDLHNVSEKRQVGHYWLRDPLLAPTMGQAKAIGDTSEAIKTFAHEIRNGQRTTFDGRQFRHVIHVGIGGSVLGPAFLVRAVTKGPDGLTPHFVDNIDPTGILQLLHELRHHLDETLVIVVSKSGSTIETMTATAIIRDIMEKTGVDFALHAIAITTAGSLLDRKASEEGWLKTFHIWDWVGGRFSVTSAVGLLSAALAGIDITAVLDGAREMDRWTRTEAWQHNPAAIIAGALFISGEEVGKRNLAVIPYADRLSHLPRYLQQIIMESIGKKTDLAGKTVEQGLTVYGYKGSTDQHATMQQLRDGRKDTLILFVQALCDGLSSTRVPASAKTASTYLQGFLLGTRRALKQTDRPNLLLTIPVIDAYNIGALIALSERVVSLYVELIQVNGYDQPGVEAGKTAAKEILSLRSEIHKRLDKGPATFKEVAQLSEEHTDDIFYILERDVANGDLCREGIFYKQNL
jgi:glucose-6-phosphate isomerase